MRPLLKSITAATLSLLSGCLSLRYLELPNHEVEEKKNKVTVMTYNIGNARGNTTDFFAVRSKETIEYNLDCIVEQIKASKADIIALQEVDYDSYRTEGIEQAKYIAEHAGFHAVLEDRFFSVPGLLVLGNALLVKDHSVDSMEKGPSLELERIIPYGKGLKKIPHYFKNAMYASTYAHGKKLLIGVTHLSDSKSEKKRIKEFKLNLEYLKGKSSSIFLGDLNAQPHFDSLKMFLASGFFNMSTNFGLPTYPADKPEVSLDHILVTKDLKIGSLRSISAKEVGCKESPSDHENLFADVYW